MKDMEMIQVSNHDYSVLNVSYSLGFILSYLEAIVGKKSINSSGSNGNEIL